MKLLLGFIAWCVLALLCWGVALLWALLVWATAWAQRGWSLANCPSQSRLHRMVFFPVKLFVSRRGRPVT